MSPAGYLLAYVLTHVPNYLPGPGASALGVSPAEFVRDALHGPDAPELKSTQPSGAELLGELLADEQVISLLSRPADLPTEPGVGLLDLKDKCELLLTMVLTLLRKTALAPVDASRPLMLLLHLDAGRSQPLPPLPPCRP